MAKEKDYYKLGPEASNFYDSGSGLSVSNNEVVEVTEEQRNYVAVDSAIRGRHLVEAKESEFLAYQKSLGKEAEEVEDTEEDDDEDFDISTAKKDAIISKILELTDDYTEAELKKQNKDELIEIYESIEEEDEDDNN